MKEFENGYFINENGEVFKKLKPYTTNMGYKSIKINGKHYAIHRLVASIFCDSEQPKHELVVNHIDGDKTNNSSYNLEWCTQQHNLHEYVSFGGTFVKNFNRCKMYKGNDLIGEFDSIRDASRFGESIGLSKSSLIKYLKVKDYTIVKDNGIV